METENKRLTPEQLAEWKELCGKRLSDLSSPQLYEIITALPLLLEEVERLNKCLDQAIEFGGWKVWQDNEGYERCEPDDLHAYDIPDLYEELKQRGL